LFKRRRYSKRHGGLSYEFLFIPILICIIYSQIGPDVVSQFPELSIKGGIPYAIAAAVVLTVLYFILKVYPILRRRHRYRVARMYEIDRMKGGQFEEFLAVYFRDLGYKILPHRGGAGDKGADLLMLSSDGRKFVVQAKRYAGKVPFDAIKQVHTARSLYGADAAIIISNTFFTKQTKETAQKLNIELWDRNVLIKNMYAYRSEKNA
jgi:restriction system protein